MTYEVKPIGSISSTSCKLKSNFSLFVRTDGTHTSAASE